MSRALHFLPVAADVERACVAKAIDRPSRSGDGQGQRVLAQREGIFLRRRYLQHSEGAYHRTLREVEAAEPNLVLHLAGHHGLRNAQSDAGSRMPTADRWL